MTPTEPKTIRLDELLEKVSKLPLTCGKNGRGIYNSNGQVAYAHKELDAAYLTHAANNLKPLVEAIRDFCKHVHCPDPDCSEEKKLNYAKASDALTKALADAERVRIYGSV